MELLYPRECQRKQQLSMQTLQLPRIDVPVGAIETIYFEKKKKKKNVSHKRKDSFSISNTKYAVVCRNHSYRKLQTGRSESGVNSHCDRD